MSQRTTVIPIFLFALLQVVTISVASASETLYYIVRKADWLAQSTKSSYHPAIFSSDGFIPLLTPEQVIPTARALYKAQNDLLLVKLAVSAADPRLKWDRVPGINVSLPHYYGDLSRTLVKKVYPFLPNKDGNFNLPREPFLKRLSAKLIPNSLVNKFLSYQEWQNPERFHKLQIRNFQRPKVQLQWWYFDFFLQDGSSVVMAFIPQHWWEEPGSGQEKNSVFTISLKTKAGVVKRFTTTVPQSKLKTSANHLEIPSHLVIRAIGDSDNNQFLIQVNFPEVTGTFTITPTQPPFAAFPTGVMPGFLHTVLTGAPVNSPGFSYVSQIPNSTVSGSLSWGDFQSQLSGQAYHEQGRLDDTPARQGGSWTWYHFAGDGWNIFGTPGSYIYLQQGDQIIRSGFHLISKEYTLTNRTYASPDHTKLLTGGEISFHHDNLTFRLIMSPAEAETLVCFPSPNPSQVWGTVGGTATLSISDGAATNVIEGHMFLESCSWETYTETLKK
ncbi:DUF952 domain-containing protein [Spirosoma sp. KCTC 42546]|uniref:DUF952 domain-containing protein n=1 Tax=Spirosoma sp. KCTC 42546 TaxID=2520506 RepID=UPI00115ACB7A|nr:DUF952 domain-containing protein [Spirosoma sp. KCTC 42546]QDK80703.1 DUF952 domain-containing protein [Spirosoma sp. KCTC 42546]